MCVFLILPDTMLSQSFFILFAEAHRLRNFSIFPLPLIITPDKEEAAAAE